MVSFKNKQFWKNLLSLGIPVALQNLLISSFTLIDTMMVGQLGDVSLSSVGMAGQVSWLLNIFMFGISSAAALYISQFWGIYDKKKIRLTIGIATIASLITSVFFLIPSVAIPKSIIHIFNQEPKVIETGARYLKIVAWSYPAVVLGLVLNASLRAVERVRVPLLVSFITTITNIFLDYAMIFGKFGFPKMGIEGAALATVIAAWTAPLVIAISTLCTKNILYSKPKNFLCFGLDFVKEFFKKAIPIIGNESIWGLGTVVFSVIYANIGYEQFAAVTICKTFENLVFVLFAGLGNACSIMVGKSVGIGDFKRAKDDSKRFLIITPILGAIIASFTISFRTELVSLFNMSNSISDFTFQTAKDILLVYSFAMVIRNIPYVTICGIVRPGGETKKGLVYDVIGVWLSSIPATLIAAFVFKFPFPLIILCMYAFDDILKSILSVRYVLSWKWIKPVTKEGKNALNSL